MGVVYLARDLELSRNVAVKLHAFELDADAVKRLQREAQAMAKLNHPHVLAVYEVGTVDGALYIAMEYLDGGTLRAWQAQRPRRCAEVLDAYTKAGRGLAAAHAAGVVHRDFKPENVLIGRDGRVKVGDFGLARLGGCMSQGHRRQRCRRSS